MSKPRVFKSEQLQKEFDENGFVKFRMFKPEQIRRLADYYRQTKTAHETIIDKKKFHATNETDNAALIAGADQLIKEVMMEEVDKHFFNYKTIAANYLVKQASEQSVLGPHQDLRFVDEERYYSFNLWVATEPTTKANGCLRFLKGSHRFYNTIRPLPTYPWKYRSVEKLIEENFTDVTTEVGDCVVLNHACIHASYPNLTNRVRVAAILAMVPAEASIVHYFLPEGNESNEVEEYAMTLQDFVNLKSGQRPQHAPLLRKFKYDFSAVNELDFRNKLGVEANKNKTLMNYAKQKLSTLFRIAG
jgi:ectoine hydroxylase-related dioxygenase (phytanoyl-CoA dioxygenase family)